MPDADRLQVPIVGEADLNQRAIALVAGLRDRYEITSIESFLQSCRAALTRSDLSVGVLGRFKAGKSSFLNHLIGRQILPVGVVPVTAVVTDLSDGPEEDAFVRFASGVETEIGVSDVAQYVSEIDNPDNRKEVVSVSVRVPELLRFGGLRLFDTPGLESAFVHNTEAAEQWAPNVDVALVAVAVDPPLSLHDLTLIRKLLEYTARVAVLLTKIDLLNEPEQIEVLRFVKDQLQKNIAEPIEVFAYSTRPGYEQLARAFEEHFIERLRKQISSERRVIAQRKMQTLVRECVDYIRLSLKSAELVESERVQLRAKALGEKDALEDTRLELHLIASHAISNTRSAIEKALAPEASNVRQSLQTALNTASAQFPHRLDKMIDAFQAWLDAAMSARLIEISEPKRSEFEQPLFDVQRQYQRVLQSFRDRLSDRVMELYGVPLRTTESAITVQSPRAPDVRIGRVFDHSWELLAPILPMGILRPAVMRRLRRKVADETFKNFSRLTTQWADVIAEAILKVQREAERRIEELVNTVERLTSSAASEAKNLRDDLAELENTARKLEGVQPVVPG